MYGGILEIKEIIHIRNDIMSTSISPCHKRELKNLCGSHFKLIRENITLRKRIGELEQKAG